MNPSPRQVGDCDGRHPWILVLAALALAACDLQEIHRPESILAGDETSPPEQLQTVTHVAFEVDPVSGAVRLGEAVPPNRADGLRPALLGSEHVTVTVTCRGCEDAILDNQEFHLRFAVNRFFLEGLDFRRTDAGDAIGAMTCLHCTIRSAKLEGFSPSPLPAELQPNDVFVVTLRVDALEYVRFTVRFALVASVIEVPPAGPTYTQIASYYLHSCALRTDGGVTCWGTHPLLGRATSPAGNQFTQVTAGWTHSCALRTDGSLACWGGNGSPTNKFIGQADPPTGTDYVQVSAGEFHNCALRANGSIRCWGWNRTDDLPRGSHTGQATPPAGTDFAQVDAGAFHTCALRVNGSLVCWGDKTYGQTNVPPGNDFIQVSAGGWHGCALGRGGSATCWGYDYYGQVSGTPKTGAPYTGQYTHPGPFTQVVAGPQHTCALKPDGIPVCWGADFDGETSPPEGARFTQISAGTAFNCGLRLDGTAACWGSNWGGAATPPWE